MAIIKKVAAVGIKKPAPKPMTTKQAKEALEELKPQIERISTRDEANALLKKLAEIDAASPAESFYCVALNVGAAPHYPAYVSVTNITARLNPNFRDPERDLYKIIKGRSLVGSTFGTASNFKRYEELPIAIDKAIESTVNSYKAQIQSYKAATQQYEARVKSLEFCSLKAIEVIKAHDFKTGNINQAVL